MSFTNVWTAYFPRPHPFGVSQNSLRIGRNLIFGKFCLSKSNADSTDKNTWNGEVQVDDYSVSTSIFGDEEDKERQRRRKIGMANKGMVPWNKGKKHSAETRLRIKERTIEAMRNPQVRKKMAEQPHPPHSDEIKARISSSLKKIWAKRLKRKRLGEIIFLSWAKSIAKAAKKGGTDQQELDWDSYDKQEQEIALQESQRAAGKVKAKELAKMRAAQDRIARYALKQKKLEEKARVRREIKRNALKRSKSDLEECVAAQEWKLKQRLMKIRRKVSMNGHVGIQGETVIASVPTWEKLDAELIRGEKTHREVSLEEQIQAAKNKRIEPMAGEVLVALSAVHKSNEARGE
ncbi:inner centromere protein isoform X4 [Tripterygium wilfordii]|uniref:Inner centromere protein isoform X4 n=2 Tax=Tripterygium wilfordii TaxID=458696 RepID=A0A7J7C1Q3_TRIWF|nr:inner centromere protein isoform X4 [Tripterygium wilfordii]